MTITYAPVCAACGATNLATRFCESCGQPATQAQESASLAPWARRAWTATLVVFILSSLLPLLAYWVFYDGTVGKTISVLFAFATSACAASAVLASARGARRWGALALVAFYLLFGVISAFVYIVQAYGGVLSGVALLSAWLIATSKRGRTFASIAIGFGFLLVSVLVSSFVVFGIVLLVPAAIVGTVLIARVLE